MSGFPSTGSSRPVACVLACSGCCAAGELADQTARRLQKLGVAEMICLAGVDARIPSILATLQDASGILMIDGCWWECGAKLLRKGECLNFKHFKLHEAGVHKYNVVAVDEATMERLVHEAMQMLSGSGDESGGSKSGQDQATGV